MEEEGDVGGGDATEVLAVDRGDPRSCFPSDEKEASECSSTRETWGGGRSIETENWVEGSWFGGDAFLGLKNIESDGEKE